MSALLEADTSGPSLRKGLEIVETALGQRLSKDEAAGLDTLLTGLEVQTRIAPEDVDRLRSWISKEGHLRQHYETKLACEGLSVAAKGSLIGGLLGFATLLAVGPEVTVSFNVDSIFAAAMTLSTMVGIGGAAMGAVINESTTYGLNHFEAKLEPTIAALERSTTTTP